MRSRGRRWGRLPRAITALIVAFLATAAALHLFLSDTRARQIDTKPVAAGTVEADPYVEVAESAEPAPPAIVIQTNLDRSASIARYLGEAGLNRDDAKVWAGYFQRVARTGLLRKDHPITVYKDPETGDLRGFKYDIDDRVQISEASLGGGVIKAYQQPIRYVVKPVSVAFAVRDSFRKTAAKNHVPPQVVEALADAFSGRYDLDDAKAGTAVKLIYDERVSHDGAHRLPGDVDAAEIQFGSRTMHAFAFRDEHGMAHLYDEQGQALGPQFLRFPLNFQYISSGFTMHRYHPLLHEYRPHVGVDLAANYGTPVKAIADGRVETAGWCGELGNCIRIEHDNGTTSIYGHLSKISRTVRTGSYAKIGEVIGLVGSTGLSTGPHLHFALEKRGAYVNPLTEKLGVHHEVSPRMQALFQNLRGRYQNALAKLPNLGSHFALAGTRKPAISPLGDMYHVTLAVPKASRRRHRRRAASAPRVFRTATTQSLTGEL